MQSSIKNSEKSKTKPLEKIPKFKKYPFVSIIMATYSRQEVLKKTLASLLNQDYKGKYEIIVVDDKSKDNTPFILKELAKKNKKLRIHLSEKNQGAAFSRNKAISLAHGQITINMDDDCIAKKYWLSNMIKPFTEEENLGIVSGYAHYGGTSTAFPTLLLKKVKGYDTDYAPYSLREDTDLSFKIMDLGYKFKLIPVDYIHDHFVEQPKSFLDIFSYGFKRLQYHRNDVILYKKHPTSLTRKFLNIKYGFLISPMHDFKTATGLWEGKFNLSSPRGIVFLKPKTPIHILAIILLGISYVFAIKTSRLFYSLKYRKLLI